MSRKIVDFHAHAFHDKIAEKAANNLNDYYNIPLAADGHFEYVLNSMKENEITKMVIHATATTAKQVEMTNDYVASLINKDIIGFGSIHPDYTNVEKELDRIESLGLKGLKLHPIFQGFVMDDEKMFPIYEQIAGRYPILMHAGDKNSDATTPKRIAHLLDKFPNLTIIAAHLGGYSEWEEAQKYILGRNLYIDTSSAIRFLTPERSKELIQAHGADKVLFGTDYPLSLHKEELDVFDKIDLSDEERERILWKNAYKLLKISDDK
ncbi:MAG: amidohydrolase [Clostridia bacterium]|nr:amidohydrolase [Clostridia bacterium]